MAWDAKFRNYGVIKIERDSVLVYSDRSDYVRIYHPYAVSAQWAGDAVLITDKSGQTLRFTDRNHYDRIY